MNVITINSTMAFWLVNFWMLNMLHLYKYVIGLFAFMCTRSGVDKHCARCWTQSERVHLFQYQIDDHYKHLCYNFCKNNSNWGYEIEI